MTPDEMSQKAQDLFLKRMHWSQAILAVGLEKLNIQGESAIKAVGVFGGGIVSSGNVCGILLGGEAAISTLYSRCNLKEKENPRLWSTGNLFLQKFQELTQPFGGMNCCDIAKVDWHNRDAVKDYYTNPESSRKICTKLLGDAAILLGEILEQETATKDVT